MYIDTHVHLRDFKQQYKETIKHGLDVARDSGVDAVFDMPNTDPPILTREIVEARLQRADDARVPEVFYGLYIGATKDTEQLKRAVEMTRLFFPRVVGIKLYAGHSVGELGVTTERDQFKVYETLACEGYGGLLAVHCEKESEMNKTPFNPLHAITHCFARPEQAEVESVKDQLRFVRETGFSGKLHIAHISSPTAVELVHDAKLKGRDISCAICPHHFIYDWQQMNVDQMIERNEGATRGAQGLLWKMNPPLRSPESRAQVLDYLREGKIDWIETDHAPHTLPEKMSSPFMSGIPGLAWWPLFEEYLRSENFSDALIEQLTFHNAAQRFGLEGLSRTVRRTKDRRREYAFDPYKQLEHLITEVK